MEVVATTAGMASEVTTFTAMGEVFQTAKFLLETDEDFEEYLDSALLCEQTFPRLFNSWMSDVSVWIEACTQVSNSSSTYIDDRCLRLGNELTEGASESMSRLEEAMDWVVGLE